MQLELGIYSAIDPTTSYDQSQNMQILVQYISAQDLLEENLESHKSCLPTTVGYI